MADTGLFYRRVSEVNKAYEIAKEIANSGDYTLLSDILDELYHNWEGTYNLTVQELKDTITWNEEN
jgi:hypothetical protein